MFILLLTATINPNGMKNAKFSPKEREKMYIDTLNYYIYEFAKFPNESFSLVFLENSGWDSTTILNNLNKAPNVQIEYITLNSKEFNIEKGKSYNEMLLIDKGIEQSETIKKGKWFFKVTGRFPILNIYKLLKEVEKRGGNNMQFYGDCKDHKVYDWLHLPINGHAGECRYYATSVDFYNKNFKGKYKDLCDYEGKLVENLFLQVIRENKHNKDVHYRFRTQAHLTGSGGHSLGKGLSFFYSTNNDSVSQKCKRAIRQLLRWIIPWWLC